MKKWTTCLFELEKKPVKGLLSAEWLTMGYLVLTLLIMAFMYTKLPNTDSIIKLRVNVTASIAALWLVYRLVPCRATRLARVMNIFAWLGLWYPDIYEFTRVLPNMDHLFAAAEQAAFGCQPALLLPEALPYAAVSEPMNFGYWSYFSFIGFVEFFYFFCRYKQFDRAVFIVIGSFFTYYILYLFLPVAGPQFYYLPVGIEQITQGIFPNIGTYFLDHTEMLTAPGWSDGLFYQLVEDAHISERPIAAFPSSHVGISTIIMILAWQTKSRRLFWCITPVYVLLCLSTVYTQAHYLIDVLAGWVTSVLLYLILNYCYKLFFPANRRQAQA